MQVWTKPVQGSVITLTYPLIWHDSVIQKPLISHEKTETEIFPSSMCLNIRSTSSRGENSAECHWMKPYCFSWNPNWSKHAYLISPSLLMTDPLYCDDILPASFVYANWYKANVRWWISILCIDTIGYKMFWLLVSMRGHVCVMLPCNISAIQLK